MKEYFPPVRWGANCIGAVTALRRNCRWMVDYFVYHVQHYELAKKLTASIPLKMLSLGRIDARACVECVTFGSQVEISWAFAPSG
jgi:hypothetical protein